MFEDEKDPSIKSFKTGLAIFALFAVVFVAGSMFIDVFASSKGETSHPPTVSITRTGDQVTVRYMGGIDTAFVGDFKIVHDGNYTIFKNPGEKNIVGIVTSKDCIKVYAIDKATLYWRPIGYEMGSCDKSKETLTVI